MVAASNLQLQQFFTPTWPEIFHPTFDGIKSNLQFFLTYLQNANFPWPRIKFPEISLTLKNFFFPDHFLTCGNHVYHDYSSSFILANMADLYRSWIVWFQKVSTLLHRRSLEILRGRGLLKAKLLEEKYEAKLKFPRGWGGVKQKPLKGWGGGEYGHFLEINISKDSV